MSEYEDEDVSPDAIYSKLDEERLGNIKKLIFNTFRDKIGQDQMDITQFAQILNEISASNQGKTFAAVLFE